MGRFYIGPLVGPLLAPLIGGFLSQRWGWRATQWFLVIYGAVALCLLLFALPETTKDRRVLPEEKTQELRGNSVHDKESTHISASRQRSHTQQILHTIRRLFFDPLKITLLLRHLPIFFTAYYAALAFGSLYVMNISVQGVFAKPPYNFSTSKIGLLYLPVGLGFLISALFGGKWGDRIMARQARKKNRYDQSGNLLLHPEDRMMENAWLAAIGFPISMVWYGWTSDKGVFWIVPVSSIRTDACRVGAPKLICSTYYLDAGQSCFRSFGYAQFLIGRHDANRVPST